MISYKCDNCGAEMFIGPSGGLVCPYCGSSSHFSDSELRKYKEFRNNMLVYLKEAAENKADETATRQLWGYAETDLYETKDGEDIYVEYIFKTTDDGVKMYMCRETVVYIFDEDRKTDAYKMLNSINLVAFPKADMKRLDKCIPKLQAKLELKDGGVLVAFAREENMYPLGAFGILDYKHAAWILSRLENICCILEYSGIKHTGITLEGVYINPYTHEAALYGGWWKSSMKTDKSRIDLFAIREVTKRIMGVHNTAPKGFMNFLNSEPQEDAYTDFNRWDYVIEHDLGGRHFHKMETISLNKEM